MKINVICHIWFKFFYLAYGIQFHDIFIHFSSVRITF